MLKRLTPMLEANDLVKTLEFYQEILRFELSSCWPETGPPEWILIRRDSIEIMYTARNDHHRHLNTGLTGTLYFYTDQVEDLWN